ncbi:Lsr2 dimerization domain-containing protein [Streptomyces abikoensis]|uniref:Histone-like nucleoid-structuring protein Lsr2 n=1 Tax=Streptomyces abikoensis TaxID=97398 RepID=A0ABW7T4R5_9ACTN
MAKHVETYLVDDLTGERGNVSEHVIALNGRRVAVDLSVAAFADLEKKLAPYFAAGRRPRGGPSTRTNRTALSKQAAQEPTTAEIRAWAKRRRIGVFDRGRIPEHIRQQYIAAHQQSAA